VKVLPGKRRTPHPRSSLGLMAATTWVKMCSVPAYLVTAGDIDGDGTDDLIGTWSSGVWVKYSETGTWAKICTPLPSDIDAGLFRTGWGAGAISFEAPIGGVYAEGPGSIDNYVDLSSEGPGGWNFAFQVEENLVPQVMRLGL